MDNIQPKASKRRSRTLLFAVALCASFAPILVVASDCEHSRVERFDVSSADVKSLRIRSAQGDLKVSSHSSGEQIRVEGQLCAERERDLDDLEIEQWMRGDALVIRTEIPDDYSFFWRNRHSLINLSISIPAGMDLEIRDGSGPIEVSGSGNTDIKDGSGSIEVRDIAGDLSIDDGSGSIDVRNIEGRVSLEDGSGSISVRSSKSVHVEDGSGSIEVDNIQGDVVIADGSGKIIVSEVTGLVDISDGSGHMEVQGIAGQVYVTDGSGDIIISDVMDDVIIGADGSGSIAISRAHKSVEIANDGSGNVDIDTVGEGFRILNKGSGNIAYDAVEGEIFLPRHLR